MKIILEIEAEIDGEWREGDEGLLENAVLENPHYGVWTIEEDRLNIINNFMSVEVRR